MSFGRSGYLLRSVCLSSEPRIRSKCSLQTTHKQVSQLNVHTRRRDDGNLAVRRRAVEQLLGQHRRRLVLVPKLAVLPALGKQAHGKRLGLVKSILGFGL